MNMLRGTSDLHPDEEVLRFLIQALTLGKLKEHPAL